MARLVKNLLKFPALIIAVCIAGIITSAPTDADAQFTYRKLLHESRNPHIYFNRFTLPGTTDSTVNFVTSYRVDYDFMNFKKVDDPSSNKEGKNFYASAKLNIEMFEANDPGKDGKRKNIDKVSLENLAPAARSFWEDTAYAETYEQTNSDKEYLTGYMQLDLKPGTYNYILQLTNGGGHEEKNSKKQRVKIEDYFNRKSGEIYYLNDVDDVSNPTQGNLINFSNSVIYGKDFYALIQLPRYDAGTTYNLHVYKMDVSRKDTTQQDQLFNYTLSSNDIHPGIRLKLDSNTSETTLLFDKSGNNKKATYALVKIPNRTFPNTAFRLEVIPDGEKKPIARQLFRSRWVDMPTSLLNVNVAIDMMHYIVDKDTLKKLKNGSTEEREKHFRNFWKEKDPTPDTEYNELMVEYYRRVDYAYEHFSSPQVPGYDSDQGKIYIRMGAPNRIERKFPPGKPTTEIWHYGNKTFVFQATSGFGDFKLVSD